VSRPSGPRLYRGAVRGLSFAFVALGLLVLVLTFANGGGPASAGFLIGVAFLAVGVGRLWLATRMERERR
jgi:hypothetical protein